MNFRNEFSLESCMYACSVKCLTIMIMLINKKNSCLLTRLVIGGYKLQDLHCRAKKIITEKIQHQSWKILPPLAVK